MDNIKLNKLAVLCKNVRKQIMQLFIGEYQSTKETIYASKGANPSGIVDVMASTISHANSEG